MLGLFGDGSDGPLLASFGIISCTRDMNFTSAERGSRVRANGYRLFFTGEVPVPTVINGVFCFGDIDDSPDEITIELDTPNGPRVEYGPDDDATMVDAAVPAGWRVDWETPAFKLASGRFRSPLVEEPAYCECGTWSGRERCDWTGREGELVTVEFMPEQHRSSHIAAANRGSYPNNGAVRIDVSPKCAALMVETDSEWIKIVPGTNKGDL